MTDTARSFKRGAEAAKAAASNSFSSRVGYFSLEEGNRAYVQFITDWDEWYVVDSHAMVPTKPRAADWQGDKWPSTVQPVCRHTIMGDGLPIADDCYVCSDIPSPKDPNKPFPKSSRTWALGVLLEEVFGDGSPALGGPTKKDKRVGYKMKMVESVDKDTKETTMVPEVVVFTFGWKNFFAALEGAAQVNDGTICNLAFAIQREGKGLDTKYIITSMGPQKRDFREAEHLAKLGIDIVNGEKVYPDKYDLGRMIFDRASDDYYARFIDPNKTPAKNSGASPGSKPSTEAEPADLQAMRNRLLGYSEAAAAAEVAEEVAVDPTEDSNSDLDLDEL